MNRLPVTHHAIIRYLERAPGGLGTVVERAKAQLGGEPDDSAIVECIQMDKAGRRAINVIRTILGKRAKRIHAELGDGRYPIANGYVVIRNAKVVTYTLRVKP